MVPELRQAFNQAFTPEKYQAYLDDLNGLFPGQLDFRVAETPVFVDRRFRDQLIDACSAILEEVQKPDYHQRSAAAIPDHLRVPGEDAAPHCIAFDFGVCTAADGSLEPQLIEMQGFPTLFCWEVLLVDACARHFALPSGYSPYLGGFDRESYIDLLRRVLLDGAQPEHTILLEVLPHQQKTRVDFYATEQLLGIRPVCLTEVIREGRELFYMRDGRKTPVRRIFNRVIFDDLYQQPQAIQEAGKIFQEELDLTWVPHPNWFYRLSKFTLPFIDHPYVPKTQFLHEARLPADLENYVVKPLFSFAGQGVIIDVTKADIDNIPDPQNWILQRKVNYAAVIETPDEPAKAEIRIFYFRDPATGAYVPANNLARLSKGKMIGVRYNKDKEWVGGSFCLFEQGE